MQKNSLSCFFVLSERVSGIEPPSSAWKADIINHYTIPANKIKYILINFFSQFIVFIYKK